MAPCRFLEKPIYSEVFANETGGFLLPQVTLCFENALSNLHNVRGNITNPMDRGYKLWPDDISGRRSAQLMMFHYFFEQNFSIPFGGLMWFCRREKKNCSISDFKSHWDPQFGPCFIYAPAKRSLTTRGREEGLIFGITSAHMLRTSQHLKMSKYTNLFYRRSIFVSIDDMDTFPDMGYAYSVKGSTRVSAGIERLSKSSLNRPGKPCTFEEGFATVRDPFGRLRRYKSTWHLCLAKQKQRAVVEKCRCYSEEVPLHENLFNIRLPWCHRMRPEKVRLLRKRPLSPAEIKDLEEEMKDLRARAACEGATLGNFKVEEQLCNWSCHTVLYKASFMNTVMDRFSSSSGKSNCAP